MTLLEHYLALRSLADESERLASRSKAVADARRAVNLRLVAYALRSELYRRVGDDYERAVVTRSWTWTT